MKYARRGLVALLAILALGVLGAGNASAAATTTAAKWYTGPGPGTELTKPKTVTASLKSSVFTLKDPTDGIEMSATGVSCQGCTIENQEVTGKVGKAAFGTGKILFSGVTVLKPEHCIVESESGVEGQIVTKPLDIYASFMNGTVAVQQFVPQSGTTFAKFAIPNSGVCPLGLSHTATGTLFADAANATGVFKVSQESSFSPAIETADGGGLFMPGALEPTGTIALNIGGTEFTVK